MDQRVARHHPIDRRVRERESREIALYQARARRILGCQLELGRRDIEPELWRVGSVLSEVSQHRGPGATTGVEDDGRLGQRREEPLDDRAFLVVDGATGGERPGHLVVAPTDGVGIDHLSTPTT